MTVPGPLIASGRDADVYALGDGLVLRRYRRDHDTLYEAAVMQHVGSHGFGVPRVAEIAGRDMVMERVDGPTMLADFAAKPWRLRRHAATLARLQHDLHAIPGAPWMRHRWGNGDASVVHFDLHPDNVLLSERGPVVIDWANAGTGSPDTEVAHLWMLMATSVIPAGRIERTLLNTGRRAFIRSFLKHFDVDRLRKHVRTAARHRFDDRNVLDVEREKIMRFVERWALD